MKGFSAQAQGDGNLFKLRCPFDKEFLGDTITFTGTGHGLIHFREPSYGQWGTGRSLLRELKISELPIVKWVGDRGDKV